MTAAPDGLGLRAEARHAVASETSAENAQEEPGARGPLLAPLMARAIVAVFFCGFGAVAFLYVEFTETSFRDIGLSVVYLLILLTLQLFYFSRPGTNLGAPLTYAVLAVQAALTFLPLFQFGYPWTGIPALLAGTLLLVLPPRAAWPVFAGIVVIVAFIDTHLSNSGLDATSTTVGTLVTGLEVYGLTRMASAIIELHAARTELAKTAVAHERLRFARDLHDLLGLNLSAIEQRGELTLRL